MTYTLESVSMYVTAAKDNQAKVELMLADVLGGKYPILCDTDGYAFPDVFMVSCYHDYDMPDEKELDSAPRGSMFTVMAGDNDLLAELNEQVESGSMVAFTASGSDIHEVIYKAWEGVYERAKQSGLRAAYANDYEVYDLTGSSGSPIAVTLFMSVKPMQ